MLDNGHHVDRERSQGTQGSRDVNEEAILEGDYQSLVPSKFEVNHPAKPFNLPYPQNYNESKMINLGHYILGQFFYMAVGNQKITSSDNSFKPS